jgi:hypothetical protein
MPSTVARFAILPASCHQVRKEMARFQVSDCSFTLTNGYVMDRPPSGWNAETSWAGVISSLTQSLTVELARGRINCVSLGVMDSELFTPLGDMKAPEEAGARRLGREVAEWESTKPRRCCGDSHGVAKG